MKSQPFAGLFTLSNDGPVEFKGLVTVGIAKASEASSPNAYWAPLGHPTPIQTYTVASGGKVNIKIPDDQLTSDPGSYVMKVFYTTDLSRAGDSNLGTSAWTPLGGRLEFTVKDKVNPIPVTFQAELNDFDANQQDTDAFKVGDKIVYVAKVQLAATSGQPVTQLKYTMKYGMDAGGTPRFTTDLGNTRAGFIHNGQTTNTPIQSDTFSNGIRTVVLAPTFTLQPGDTAYLITEVAAPSGTATGAYTTNVELNTIGFTDKLPTTPIFATDTTSISSSQGVAALSGRDFKLFPPEVGRGGTIVASGVVKNDGSAKYVGKMYAAVKVNNSWIPIETKDVILDSGQEQEVVFNGIANFAPGTYETQLFYLDGMTWKPIGNSSLKVTTNTMSVWEGVLRPSGFSHNQQISLKNEADTYESTGFFKLMRDGYSSCSAFVRLGVKVEKTGASTIKVTTTRLDNTQRCDFADGSYLTSGGLGVSNIYNITISGNDMIVNSSESCDFVLNETQCFKFSKFSRIGLSTASIFGAPSFTVREYNPATDGPLDKINQVYDRR
ncbi:hypothetical protein ACINK0_17575 (plasmid) [Deinococcus sp. VB343]|uniref:hypothetical protein n=1 Tax=Deinococcus sp. VB343 TaxID=3385567 RepID=UPI0039C957D3